jgi:hypothetical protein
MVLKEITVWGALVIGKPFIVYFISSYGNSVYLFVAVVASAIILGIILYLSMKIDWGKIIGKWFPWALTDDSDQGKKTGDNN